MMPGFKRKIPAQAMQFVLLISTLVFLLLGSFVLLTYTQSFFSTQSTEVRSHIALATNQLVRLLETPHLSRTSDTLRSEVRHYQTRRIASYYGAWTKVFTEVNSHGNRIRRAALAGTTTTAQPNLYLANFSSPLVVTGHTRLEGDLRIPKLGIQAGTIGGRYYEGRSLHYGRTKISDNQLPELDPQWLLYTEKLLAKALSTETGLIPLQTELRNSFYQSPRIVYEPGPVFLDQHQISGNISIYSDTKITVHPETSLSDVLLIAPEIQLLGNVQGRMHLIASKRITIGNKCHLSYPSSVVLISKEKPLSSPSSSIRPDAYILPVEIKDQTIIEGSVIYFPLTSPDESTFTQIHLKTHPKTTIRGEVYCQGNYDFQGTVRGSLYAHRFVAQQEGSLYINHIYDGQILRDSIPQYAGLPFENKGRTSNAVAKWMY